MQVILDSSFARPGSAPIWGGKKGDFRDWTIISVDEKMVVKWLIVHIIEQHPISRLCH